MKYLWGCLQGESLLSEGQGWRKRSISRVTLTVIGRGFDTVFLCSDGTHDVLKHKVP